MKLMVDYDILYHLEFLVVAILTITSLNWKIKLRNKTYYYHKLLKNGVYNFNL